MKSRAASWSAELTVDGSSGAAEGPERGAHLGREESRFLPSGKVVAPVEFVEVDEVGIGLLGPTPWRLVELAGEDADGRRHRHAFYVEERQRVLPVQPAGRDTCIGHPGQRDVVEDLVPGQVADW